MQRGNHMALCHTQHHFKSPTKLRHLQLETSPSYFLHSHYFQEDTFYFFLARDYLTHRLCSGLVPPSQRGHYAREQVVFVGDIVEYSHVYVSGRNQIVVRSDYKRTALCKTSWKLGLQSRVSCTHQASFIVGEIQTDGYCPCIDRLLSTCYRHLVSLPSHHVNPPVAIPVSHIGSTPTCYRPYNPIKIHWNG